MRNLIRWLVAASAVWTMAAATQAEEPEVSTDGLRHAVVCPPFKGPSALAALYHGEMVKMLQGTDGIDYVEGSRTLRRHPPEFTFRVVGKIAEEADGQAYVTVSLVDTARKEQVASQVSLASADGAKVKTCLPFFSIASTASDIIEVLPVPAPPRISITRSGELRTCSTALRWSALSHSRAKACSPSPSFRQVPLP